MEHLIQRWDSSLQFEDPSASSVSGLAHVCALLHKATPVTRQHGPAHPRTIIKPSWTGTHMRACYTAVLRIQNAFKALQDGSETMPAESRLLHCSPAHPDLSQRLPRRGSTQALQGCCRTDPRAKDHEHRAESPLAACAMQSAHHVWIGTLCVGQSRRGGGVLFEFKGAWTPERASWCLPGCSFCVHGSPRMQEVRDVGNVHSHLQQSRKDGNGVLLKAHLASCGCRCKAPEICQLEGK